MNVGQSVKHMYFHVTFCLIIIFAKLWTSEWDSDEGERLMTHHYCVSQLTILSFGYVLVDNISNALRPH